MTNLLRLAVVLLLVSCATEDEPGLSVDIAIEAPSSPALVARTRSFETNRGFRVILEKGHFATGSINLLECHEDGHHDHHHASSPSRWKERLWRLVLPSAHAHSMESPVELGTPVVESLLAASGARIEVGTLRPPPGRYCGLRYAAFPSDHDAIGLSSEPAMEGWTLRIEGSYQAVDAAEPSPFAIRSKDSFEVDLVFPAVELDGEVTSASFAIGKVGDRWFDDLDFEAQDEEAIAASVLSQIRASLKVSSP